MLLSICFVSEEFTHFILFNHLSIFNQESVNKLTNSTIIDDVHFNFTQSDVDSCVQCVMKVVHFAVQRLKGRKSRDIYIIEEAYLMCERIYYWIEDKTLKEKCKQVIREMFENVKSSFLKHSYHKNTCLMNARIYTNWKKHLIMIT